MATGENNTTWGDVTNLNLGTALEEAIVGSADVTFASADVTLTLTDTNASQTARNMRLRCTGTTGGATRNLVVPSIEKPYIVRNDCADSVVVKTTAGTGITVPAGKTMWVYSDATNVVDAVTHLSSLTLGTDLAVSDGGTGASTFTANGVIYGNTTSALLATAAGTTGQVLVGNTGGAPSWATLTGIGVTSFSGGTTGFTPSTATTGVVTLAGTLGVANGGTGTATAFTAGSVVFAGASGVYSQDNANLFWDNANDRLGIGTASPLARLNVEGGNILLRGGFMDFGPTAGANGAGRISSALGGGGVSGSLIFSTLNSSASMVEAMRIDASGNVLAGLTSASGLTAGGGSIVANGVLMAKGALSDHQTNAGVLQYTGNVTAIRSYGATASTGAIAFNTGGGGGSADAERMRIDSSGNVGIGTASPTNNLTVYNGTSRTLIRAASDLNFSGAYLGTATSTNRGASLELLTHVDGSNSAGWRTAAAVDLFGGLADMVFSYATNSSTYAGLSYSERMRITTPGNLLVGTSTDYGGRMTLIPTTSPTSASASTNQIAIGESSANTGYRLNVGYVLVSGSYYAGSLQAIAGSVGAPLLLNADGGNVGIGTYGPSYLLECSNTADTVVSAAVTNASTGTAAQTRIRLNNSIGTFGALTHTGGSFTSSGVFRQDGTYLFGNGAGGVSLVTGAATPIVFATNSSENMRITSAGNVGIGTSSPTLRLTVASGVVGNVSGFSDGIAQSLVLTTGTGYFGMYNPNYGSITFRDGGNVTEHMRIDVNGKVGIGTTGPAYLLDVAASGSSGGIVDVARFYASAAGAATSRILFGSPANEVCAAIGAQTTTATSGDLTFYTEAGGSLGERMRINASGDTTITGTGNPTLTLASSAGGYSSVINMNSSAAGGSVISATQNFIVQTGGTQRMVIDNAGLFSIGTTATLASLTVGGTGGSGQVAGFRNALYLRSGNSSGNQSSFICFGSAGTVSSCFIGNDIQGDGTTINRLDVQAGGSGGVFLASGGTSWTAFSDERGKDIIEPISNATQKVSTLRAVIGKYKTDAEGTRRSFLIAQDVQAVLPEAVTIGTDEQHTLGVAYTDTIPLLVAAIKELTARVAQLEGN
jgi:hypothetical protein